MIVQQLSSGELFLKCAFFILKQLSLIGHYFQTRSRRELSLHSNGKVWIYIQTDSIYIEFESCFYEKYPKQRLAIPLFFRHCYLTPQSVCCGISKKLQILQFTMHGNSSFKVVERSRWKIILFIDLSGSITYSQQYVWEGEQWKREITLRKEYQRRRTQFE